MMFKFSFENHLEKLDGQMKKQRSNDHPRGNKMCEDTEKLMMSGI